MKRSYILLLLLTGAIACNKTLDTEPQTSMSDEDVIVDKKSALAALVGVYDGLQGYASNNIIGLDLAADNVVNYNNQNTIIPNLTPASAGGGFSNIYSTIQRANFVINKVPGVQDVLFSLADRNQVLGEAYFVRALAYFDLVKTYGGVQIVLDPLLYRGIKRSTKEQTYAQVLADLGIAETLLPDKVDRNKPTLYTVFALKARVYLYTAQWDLAEQYASKTIRNAGFKLVKPFADYFTVQNTTESIFELAFSTSDKNNFYTNWLSPTEGGRHDYIPAREIIGPLLNPDIGGARKSLVKQLSDGSWELIEYGKQDGSSSLFLFRIAEQYLIRAEARVKKGAVDIRGAVEDINTIRTRSDVLEIPYTASLQAGEVLLAIENERKFELAFEGHRFVDIIRTGRASAVFGILNSRLNDSRYWVFPIPQSAILADPDNLEQNEGYK